MSLSSESDSSSDGDIWDEIESEGDSEELQEVDSSVSEVVSGISFFLTFYHLLYRLSHRAITNLLGFVRLFLNYLAVLSGQEFLLRVANAMPKSMLTVQATFKQDSFTEYVVCPRCFKLYTFEDCVVNVHGRKESKYCDYIEFPNHPHPSRRKACGEVLLKTIKVGGKIKLVPRKEYVYRSIVQSLTAMMKRPGFLEKCDRWRSRPCTGDSMADIYDGKAWKDLMIINGRPFLAVPNNLCLSLNIDWFRVYEDSPYSAGPIYLAILNLPRSERYKEENIILAGIIPGPKEPKQHINSLLLPLVQDLKKLYQGVTFQNPSSCLGFTTIRATLGCVTCDLPATRKVCGFANFNANFGCSKCMKKFATPAFGSKPVYAGFDCVNWVPRNITMHKSLVAKYSEAKSMSDQKKIFHDSGIRFSELLNVPHFDIVRCHVIDPMHNVFLGLAKHTLHTWKEKGILTMAHYSQLQEKVDFITPPPRVGRIPRKIESNFASFTADEWKNWILLYSSFALYNVIDTPHFNCWSFLVDACKILCQPIVSRSNINDAHLLLVEFCKLFETLYGIECCTPNMHMSLHLKECLLDFGPFPAFWCFAFERYNGILEGISKSWVSPEKQMFQKFSAVQRLKSFSESLPKDNGFLGLICKHMSGGTANEDCGSFGQMMSEDSLMMQEFKNISCCVSLVDAEIKPHQHLIPPFKEKYFTDPELKCLHEMYQLLYPSKNFEVSRFFKQYKNIKTNGVEYISSQSRSQKSAVIAARWPGVIGIDKRGEASIRIGLVSTFIQHNINFLTSELSSTRTHILARVQWYGDHPRRSHLHSSIVITSTVFDSDSCASFIPISRIMGQCAISSPLSLKFDYGVDSVLVAIPLSYFDL